MFFSYHKMVFRNHRRFRLEPQNIFRDLKIFFYEPQHKSWLLALHPELITETCCQSPSVILCHTMVAMTHSYHLSRAFSALHRHSSHKWSTLKIELACLETQFRFFLWRLPSTCSLRPRHIRERSFTSIPTPALSEFHWDKSWVKVKVVKWCQKWA